MPQFVQAKTKLEAKNHPILKGQGTFVLMSPDNPVHHGQPEHKKGDESHDCAAPKFRGFEELVPQLEAENLTYEPTRGAYGEKERSVIVHNPTTQQVHKQIDIAKSFGQDAIVVTHNGKHYGVYVNGPHVGKYSPGQGEAYWQDEEPHDYFTALPSQEGEAGFFTLPIDWSTEKLKDINDMWSDLGLTKSESLILPKLIKSIEERISSYHANLLQLRKKELAFKKSHNEVTLEGTVKNGKDTRINIAATSNRVQPGSTNAKHPAICGIKKDEIVPSVKAGQLPKDAPSGKDVPLNPEAIGGEIGPGTAAANRIKSILSAGKSISITDKEPGVGQNVIGTTGGETVAKSAIPAGTRKDLNKPQQGGQIAAGKSAGKHPGQPSVSKASVDPGAVSPHILPNPVLAQLRSAGKLLSQNKNTAGAEQQFFDTNPDKLNAAPATPAGQPVKRYAGQYRKGEVPAGTRKDLNKPQQGGQIAAAGSAGKHPGQPSVSKSEAGTILMGILRKQEMYIDAQGKNRFKEIGKVDDAKTPFDKNFKSKKVKPKGKSGTGGEIKKGKDAVKGKEESSVGDSNEESSSAEGSSSEVSLSKADGSMPGAAPKPPKTPGAAPAPAAGGAAKIGAVKVGGPAKTGSPAAAGAKKVFTARASTGAPFGMAEKDAMKKATMDWAAKRGVKMEKTVFDFAGGKFVQDPETNMHQNPGLFQPTPGAAPSGLTTGKQLPFAGGKAGIPSGTGVTPQPAAPIRPAGIKPVR